MSAILKEMKNIDIRTVDKAILVDIKDIKIDIKKTVQEKTSEYIKQIKNPYCFLCNGYAVKLEFAENEKSIEDCFCDFIETLN